MSAERAHPGEPVDMISEALTDARARRIRYYRGARTGAFWRYVEGDDATWERVSEEERDSLVRQGFINLGLSEGK